MELFDLLEKRVMELYKEACMLREENTMLKTNSAGLAELREENRVLRETLEHEQSLRKQINDRIDMLLGMVSEHTVGS